MASLLKLMLEGQGLMPSASVQRQNVKAARKALGGGAQVEKRGAFDRLYTVLMWSEWAKDPSVAQIKAGVNQMIMKTRLPQPVKDWIMTGEFAGAAREQPPTQAEVQGMQQQPQQAPPQPTMRPGMTQTLGIKQPGTLGQKPTPTPLDRPPSYGAPTYDKPAAPREMY